MKTLTTATILLSLSVSGSAFAANSFDGLSAVEAYAQEVSMQKTMDRTGSQPAIGSTQQINFELGNKSSFWELNEDLLDRKAYQIK